MFRKLKLYVRKIKKDKCRNLSFEKLINYKTYHRRESTLIKVVDMNMWIETSIKNVLQEYEIFYIDYFKYEKSFKKNYNPRDELRQEALCGLLYYLTEEFAFEGKTPRHKVYSLLSYIKITVEGVLKKFLKKMKGYHKKRGKRELKYKRNYGLSIDGRQNYSNVDYSIITGNNDYKNTEELYFMMNNICYIKKCIENLTDKQEYILKMNQIYEIKTQKQIAEERGVSQQAISKSLRRAKSNLRDMLNEYGIRYPT